ncbi:MAG: hypothetical protein WAX80_00420 [Minisyncoccia bacterium]
MSKLTTRQELSLGLTLSHQQRLAKKWNEIVADPEAFVPHEKKGQVGLAEIITRNLALGDFASQRQKQVFRLSTVEDKLRRMEGRKKVVAVGFGRGYDSEWFEEAVLAGFEVWWVDVSDSSCDMARESLGSQFERLRAQNIHPEPVVKRGEIRSILADPDSIGLDLSTVEIWYFCRTLTCLSEKSAKIVLQQLGRASLSEEADPERNNRIELVAAMCDDNPTRIGASSKLYTLKTILDSVARGAGRTVEAMCESQHKYFDQIYTGVSIRAR